MKRKPIILSKVRKKPTTRVRSFGNQIKLKEGEFGQVRRATVDRRKGQLGQLRVTKTGNLQTTEVVVDRKQWASLGNPRPTDGVSVTGHGTPASEQSFRDRRQKKRRTTD